MYFRGKCVLQGEFQAILRHCHDGKVGGHFSANRMAAKLLQFGFSWPTLFSDAKTYVMYCDQCQMYSNISNRHEVPLNKFWCVKFLMSEE